MSEPNFSLGTYSFVVENSGVNEYLSDKTQPRIKKSIFSLKNKETLESEGRSSEES